MQRHAPTRPGFNDTGLLTFLTSADKIDLQGKNYCCLPGSSCPALGWEGDGVLDGESSVSSSLDACEHENGYFSKLPWLSPSRTV